VGTPVDQIVALAFERKPLIERRLLAFQLERDIPDVPFEVCGVGEILDFRDASLCKRWQCGLLQNRKRHN
jgi:hypothetical protein